jgi:hypothetical protein
MDALSRTLGSTALLALVLWPAPIAAQSADAQNVIDRATEYVRQFVNGFVNVVAEERYVQTANPNNPGPGPRRRVLPSDFLLVRGRPAIGISSGMSVRWMDDRCPIAIAG